MRIAHIVDSLEIGGAEILTAQLARYHRKLGHEVKLCCTSTGGTLAEELCAEGFDISILFSRSGARRALDLRNVLKRFRSDVVHCHNAASTILGAPAGRSAGARAVVSTRHGLVPPGPRKAQELKYWVAARMFCDAVVAVCATAHRNLEAGPFADPGKIITVFNGAEPAPRIPMEPRRREDEFRLLNVGRLDPVKDHRTLLHAVAIAARSVPRLRLTIIGDGALNDELARAVGALELRRHVFLAGERQDVGSWLAAADLFVLSSQSEGLPVSLLEAMAAGVPQIVTDIGGMPEIVRLSDCGVVVPPAVPEVLAKAIVELAGRRSELQRMGERGRACYQDRFTLARMATEYETLYRSCLKK